MSGTFEGRVVLVTGGGTGIGREVASAFLETGARVAIASRDPEHLKKAAGVLVARAGGAGAGERLLPVRVDVRAAESARAAAGVVMDAWGRIDVLINNAGASGMNFVDADEASDQQWLDVIATNLHGAWHMTRSCLAGMPAGGRIINISSVLGKFGVAGYSAYCASKHGLIGLTRALAAELAPRQITVNAICPGWVDTAMSSAGVAQMAQRLGVTEAEFKKAALQRVPLGRFLRPEEVAPLALYIASPDASAMTGQAINIEGGATTW